MAVSFYCGCPERQVPIAERRWIVIQYKCNHSAFSGYRKTDSDYSEVQCHGCGARGRTKSAYVELLQMGEQKVSGFDFQIIRHPDKSKQYHSHAALLNTGR